MRDRLRRQQRHHRRRPGSRRGDGALLRRELLQPEFDVRAGPAGPRGPRPCPADGRAALRAGRRRADPLHRLRLGEQQHGDLRRGQGQSAAAAHHHHVGRAPGRAGGLQGPPARRLPRSPGWTSTATAISTSASSSAPWARDAAGERHARQQRDGRRLSHRATRPADQGNRSGNRLPLRRHAIGRQDADRPRRRNTGTSTCFPSRDTSCTPPRASACCTSSPARLAGRC